MGPGTAWATQAATFWVAAVFTLGAVGPAQAARAPLPQSDALPMLRMLDEQLRAGEIDPGRHSATRPAAHRLDAAAHRLHALADLATQVDDTDAALDALQRAATALREAAPQVQGIDTELAQALPGARTCLADLADAAQRLEAAARQRQQAIEAAHAAQRLSALAQGPQARAAQARTQAAFDARAAAEGQLSQAAAHRQHTAGRCQAPLGQAWSALTRLGQAVQAQARAAAGLPAQRQGHQDAFLQTLMQAQLLSRKGWIEPPATALARPPAPFGPGVMQLVQHGTAQPGLAPPTAGDNIHTQLQRLSSQSRLLVDTHDEQALAQDAALFEALLASQASPGCGEPCGQGPQAEQARQGRLQAAQAQASQASTHLTSTAHSLGQDATRWPAWQQALRQQSAELSAATPAALAELTAFIAQAQARSDVLRLSLARASQAAVAEWRAAWLAAHGQPMPMHERIAKAGEAAGMASGAPAAAMIHIRGHAHEAIARWNTETPGFGTYTYVLFRSAPERESAEVRKRYRELLAAMQQTLRVADIIEDDRPRFNLFVVPGQERGSDISYNPELGHAMMGRAQAGILTRVEFLKKLASSPGPFLLTLPQRIAKANAQTPALFADLNGYPPEAIADLVDKYKQGLLAEFPAQQALWRPPAAQRVALLMIHLAQEASELAMQLIPAGTAEARPQP